MRELYPHTEPSSPIIQRLCPNAKRFAADLPCLILTVSENGYGKRTDVDAYRLQSRGGKSVINMKANSKVGKVVSIQLVDDTTEMMVISQVRQDHPHRHQELRAAGRSTSGVRLLNLESTTASPAPPSSHRRTRKPTTKTGTLMQ